MVSNSSQKKVNRLSPPKHVVCAGACCLLLTALAQYANADSLPAWRGGNDDEAALQRKFLRPVEVVSTTGNVQNAEALIEGNQGDATLTMVQGGAAPMVILDYGRDVGGIPIFEVSVVTGTPKLQAIYSEAQQYLLPDGDAAAPGVPQDPKVAQPEVSFVGDAAGADLSRVDTYPLSRPDLIANRLIQGGERFQVLTLASPGSVTLRQVGVQAKFFIPRRSTNHGFFRCSDPTLSEIWRLGSYAVELCSIPVQSLPTTWTVTAQGVKVPGNEYTGYQRHQAAGSQDHNFAVPCSSQYCIITSFTDQFMGWNRGGHLAENRLGLRP
jgi:hypothetical protein